MKLKKLELCGFKTFPDLVELCFHDGITATVGPNGCGKSNVIDAIRWVMGETSAKGLRGDSMEDVIFAGSDSRKPLNMAEVTLTLTEAEGQLPEKFGTYHEVAVTRRLHRSGESEYLINKIPCRLKDITELFMDTGVGRRAYSVVEQGRIDSILSAKPRDRRVLIEEAAGITKYKSRKDEAVRKMDHTAQNLERLQDVIGEVRREMNSLKRQASRAEAFKKLRSEKKGLERDLLVAAHRDLTGNLEDARGTLKVLEGELIAARARANRIGAALEQGRLRLLDEERALEALQKGVYDIRSQISQRESRIEFLERDAEGLFTRSRNARDEASELEERRGAVAAEIEGLQAELREVEARIAGRQDRLEVLAEDHEKAVAVCNETDGELDREKRTLMVVLNDLTRINHALEHATRQQTEAMGRLEMTKRQQAEVAARITDLTQEIRLRETEHASAREVCEEAARDRVRVEEMLKTARTRRHQRLKELEEARKTLHTKESRLKGLEQIKESLEGYGRGVQAILTDAKKNGANGIRGVVADTIAAPVRYETALEAALGERLQYVIVENSGRGVEGVRHLKAHRAGRSSFAPVNVRTTRTVAFPSASEGWAHGPLLDLVEVAPGYDQLARGLLGDVFVVETLEHALELWQQNGIRATLVTLEGETLSPEGVISGGAGRDEGAGLLRKNREIRELGEETRRLFAEVQEFEQGLGALDRETQDLEGRLEGAREEVHRRELQVLHIAKDLAQLEERRDRLEERREAMEFEREDLSSGIETLGGEITSLEGEKALALQRHEAVGDRVETLEAVAERSRTRADELRSNLTRHQVEEASDAQRREGLVERIRALSTSLHNVTDRVGKLREESDECVLLRRKRIEECQGVRRETEVLRADLDREESALADHAQRLDACRGNLTDEEKAAAHARREIDDAQERVHEAELAARDLELRLENLRERFRERLDGDLEAEAVRGLPEGFDPAGTEDRIQELEGKLHSFGEINLLAIEQYEERKTRYEFLETQRKDLEESLASLKQAIARINRVSRQRFGETFEKVSATFQELFPQLFRGGEARLLLTDPEDLLETGVDIIARPPGKRAQHISLLSGGEKALTAVALIFSIFLVKPSPFCILDEVDAPLDDANIGRFCEMLRHMSGSSQFLIITHNKVTMEAADHLYGITMSDPGVSKVVSVRLSDARAAEAA